MFCYIRKISKHNYMKFPPKNSRYDNAFADDFLQLYNK